MVSFGLLYFLNSSKLKEKIKLYHCMQLNKKKCNDVVIPYSIGWQSHSRGHSVQILFCAIIKPLFIYNFQRCVYKIIQDNIVIYRL